MSSPSLAERKELLRVSIRERLLRLSEKDREAESRSVVRRLLELVPEDAVVCGFIPTKAEADIRPFLEEVLRRGQRLFLPTFDGHTIALREVRDLASLSINEFSIPEPPRDAPLLDPALPVVAIIPGRAFDVRGARLGRGNGAYDRWIGERRKTSQGSTYFGTALDCQIVNEVPMAEHDQFLDGIITARGMMERHQS